MLNIQIRYLELNVKLQDYHLLCTVMWGLVDIYWCCKAMSINSHQSTWCHISDDCCEHLQSHSSDIWSFCGSENLDGDYPAYDAMLSSIWLPALKRWVASIRILVTMVNTDPVDSSSGRLQNVALRHFARPDLWIRICNWLFGLLDLSIGRIFQS